MKDYAKSFMVGFCQGFGAVMGTLAAQKLVEKINSKDKIPVSDADLEGFKAMLAKGPKLEKGDQKIEKVEMGFH